MKHTLKLKKLLENKKPPELILEYIYKHVFQLLKEIKNSYLEIDGGNSFSFPYEMYYRDVIKDSEEIWLKTIFPPYICGIKNFYQGIAGRLEYFSLYLLEESRKINNIGNSWDPYHKYHSHLILSQTPDTYYWYGNYNNWSYCYDIQLVSSDEKTNGIFMSQDNKKNILIKKRQFIFIENSKYDVAKELMLDGQQTKIDLSQILVVYKATPEDCKFELGSLSYPDPMRRFYRTDLEDIADMVGIYKNNVTKENGYNPAIGEIWDNYNKKKDEKREFIIKKDISGELKNFRVKSEEDSKLLFSLIKKYLN